MGRESGGGREGFHQWRYEKGPGGGGRFVALNGAAIPLDRVEVELFGVRRGAYTGADETRPGRFERANGGTLFLAEVGDRSEEHTSELQSLMRISYAVFRLK